jgi:hypothetical protein
MQEIGLNNKAAQRLQEHSATPFAGTRVHMHVFDSLVSASDYADVFSCMIQVVYQHCSVLLLAGACHMVISLK